MASEPAPAQSATEVSDDPLPEALAVLLERRRMTLSSLGSVLRAEGIAISRTRLHQLATGRGPCATPVQMQRLATVLGVSPGYFAEYRLSRVRDLLNPSVVGFDRAMANFERLRGRRQLADQRALERERQASAGQPAARAASAHAPSRGQVSQPI